jgi:hypothetical protein
MGKSKGRIEGIGEGIEKRSAVNTKGTKEHEGRTKNQEFSDVRVMGLEG